MSIQQEEARARVAANTLLRARHLVQSAASSQEDFDELRRHVATARRMLVRAAGNTEKLLEALGDRAAQQALATQERQP